MNQGEIAERLIQAAEIDRYSGTMVGPKQPRSLALPYAFSQADKNGWGTERLAEERKSFFESIARQPTARQVSEAEEAWGWLSLVEREMDRDALSGWAWCMAGGGYFKDWCFKRGFHPETGRRRKDRALACISFKLARKPFQHSENADYGVLLDTPEIGDIDANIAADAARAKGVRSWAADDAFSSFFADRPADFSWAAKRNERRRQREARRRKEEAA